MKESTEKKIRAHIALFVRGPEVQAEGRLADFGLNGRYREHCSDEMLIEMLMHRFTRTEYYKREKTRAQSMLEDNDPNAAYDTAQPIFEIMLEYGCRAGGNGHHVAQNFGAHMATFKLEEPQA